MISIRLNQSLDKFVSSNTKTFCLRFNINPNFLKN